MTPYITIGAAIADAQPDDTVFVCAGTYTEPLLNITDAGVSLLGPGSTPAEDGVATIKLHTNCFADSHCDADIDARRRPKAHAHRRNPDPHRPGGVTSTATGCWRRWTH